MPTGRPKLAWSALVIGAPCPRRSLESRRIDSRGLRKPRGRSWGTKELPSLLFGRHAWLACGGKRGRTRAHDPATIPWTLPQYPQFEPQGFAVNWSCKPVLWDRSGVIIRASNLGGKWFSETLGLRNARKENKVMGLLDSIVSNAFRDEKAGRVVVFSGDRRSRGYIVRSAAEEPKS
jgi:hypothetical protein